MKEKKEIIWEDVGKIGIFLERSLYFTLSLIFLLLIFNKLNYVEFFSALFMSILFFIIFVLSLTKKHPVICSKGLRTGNIVSGNIESLFSFKHKDKFLRWGDIQEIKIMNKPVKFSFVVGYPFFLIVEEKNGKVHECLINKPKLFVQNIKKLNKSRLLSKDSEYK